MPKRSKGTKVRGRSEKFFDHFSQAKLFYNSQSPPEKAHIVQALQFELGKVEVSAIRARMLGLLAQVDKTLAGLVAQGLGMKIAKLEGPMNMSVPADGHIQGISTGARQWLAGTFTGSEHGILGQERHCHAQSGRSCG